MRRNRSSRRGVALLIVVACIVVAGLAMVSVTRKSLRLATESVDKETELQQRWGVVSMQRTLLRSAPRLFSDLDKRTLLAGDTGPFPKSFQTEVLLGGVRFSALLADEQAKLNLNSIYHDRGQSAAELAVRKLCSVPTLRVSLGPEQRSDARRQSDSKGRSIDDDGPSGFATSVQTTAFRHWGQVFDLSNSFASRKASQLLPAATQQLTCWGRGEVNIARAPNEVIKEACRTALGPGVARKLVAAYRENPVLSVNQIAIQLKVKDEQRRALRRVLTTQSETYSLWLKSESANGTQLWFAVAAPEEELGIKTKRFRF